MSVSKNHLNRVNRSQMYILPFSLCGRARASIIISFDGINIKLHSAVKTFRLPLCVIILSSTNYVNVDGVFIYLYVVSPSVTFT